jgi:hypothetical protein
MILRTFQPVRSSVAHVGQESAETGAHEQFQDSVMQIMQFSASRGLQRRCCPEEGFSLASFTVSASVFSSFGPPEYEHLFPIRDHSRAKSLHAGCRAR